MKQKSKNSWMRSVKYIMILVLSCNSILLIAQQNISDLHVLLQDQFLSADQAVFSLTEQQEWKFSELDQNNWKKARVPGCVHTDIANAEELYYGDNEKKYEWVAEKNWEYTTSFRLDHTIRKGNYTSFELVFEQLDVYARVYLNGTLVMASETDNVFHPWKKDISKILKKDTSLNVLRVEFHSPIHWYKENKDKVKPEYPGGERVYTRKAQFEYGWDFGPKFVTMGIRKPVYIVARTNRSAVMEDIQITEQKVDSLKAQLEAVITIHAQAAREVYVCRTDVLPYESKKILLKPGINTVRFPFVIDRPEKWWPRGYGESVFYALRFTLQDKPPKSKKTLILSEKTVTHAFCDIELVQEKDAYGKSFYFKVNGQPVFAKGVNMVPYDVFDENWNDVQLKQVYDLNVNMVRVWGGGYYPSNEFYLYCLANGILVWQDFMFACGMYPVQLHSKTIEEEISWQVKRLRSFRNIALWCGNNEISEGWHNWGWQKEFHYSVQDSTFLRKQYRDFFENDIPRLLHSLDSSRAYWPSSPQHGWGRKESLVEGDCHYWGVWWGKQPVDTFNHHIPRFMSEYGMQSMPPAHYLLKYAPLTGSTMDRTALANHQKHPSGFGNLDFYLEKYYKVPTNIFHYVYASQLLQAYTMKTAILAHRRNRDKCMGTLLWQMNDCWPGVSWSLVDHALNKKMAYGQVKASFETVIVSVEECEKEFAVFVVSDSIKAFDDTLSFVLYDNTGKKLADWSRKVRLEPGYSQQQLSIPKTETNGWFLNSVYAVITLHQLKKETHHSFVQPNQLVLHEPQLKAEIVPVNNPCAENCFYEFRLTSDTYCPDLAYYAQDPKYGLIHRDFIDPAHPLIIRFWQEDYGFYRDLTMKPGEKFLHLYKLLKGK